MSIHAALNAIHQSLSLYLTHSLSLSLSLAPPLSPIHLLPPPPSLSLSLSLPLSPFLSSCSSLIGRRGGTQFVSMNHNCFSMGEAMHQIGHAIGLWHEHLRPDRDEYIEVLYDNIILTEQHNFQKLSLEQFRQVPDVGYDIESIMHSGPYAFSNAINGTAKRTIRLRPNAPLDYKHCSNLLAMGQRDELSYLDKLRANKLYSCQGE